MLKLNLMKTLKRLLLLFVVLVVVFLAGSLTYIKLALPNVGPAPDLTVERTPERVARGEYLANHVAVCIDCHSKRDWSRFSGPPAEGTFGMGGGGEKGKEGRRRWGCSFFGRDL